MSNALSLGSAVKELKWEQEGSAMCCDGGDLCWKQSCDGYKDEQVLVLK